MGRIILGHIEAGSGEESTVKVDDNLKVNGDLEVTGKIKYRPGQIIEHLESVCYGGTVEGVSGSYTWPNVSAIQYISVTYVDVTGSEISYTPPSDATFVVYHFYFAYGKTDADPLTHVKFLIDGSEVTDAKTTVRPYGGNPQLKLSIKYVMKIGSTDDVTTGRFSSWVAAKTIKLQARTYSTGFESRFHTFHTWDGSSATDYFVRPILSITAIR